MIQAESVNVAINPAMVILARESRGLTQSELARALGVPQSRVSMIEAGIRPLSGELLARLAESLAYPPQHFYQASIANGIGIPEIFHRKRRNVPKSALAKLYALIEIRLIHLRKLLRSLDVEDCVIQEIRVADFNERVEEIARTVRVQLRLPRGPIADLTETLETAGVVVISFDFGTSLVDAISRWLPAMPPVFFVNQRSPKDRLRFSLAHELGHVVMHGLPHPEMEAQADCFAAEFLMPERDVNLDFNRVDLVQLGVLKRYWRVSMAALLKRAETLQKVSPSRARYLWTQLGRAGYRTREPFDLDANIEQPVLVHELIEAHQEVLGYTEADLKDLLPLCDDDFQQWYLDTAPKSPLRLVR